MFRAWSSLDPIVDSGFSSDCQPALWAEVYGVESRGTTKSTVAMLGIFGTALGPLLLGWLLKVGVGFGVIIPGCALLAVLAMAISFLARGTLRGFGPPR